MSATESSTEIETTEFVFTPFQTKENKSLCETIEQTGGKIRFSEDNEFFKGLVERAGYYEQFEDRRSKITYSSCAAQSEIGIYMTS
ncbi:hypothetical protein [Methanolapillus millepedarum]|uniref:Uncharacterized protein n=1 Tax=Methanolapillus millepedarum TaxID=3028296 RepID=A0AA97A307_9EURY|nr:hypothetical protein MsAc7_01000 [Methanosarcinaceae archaeon Ac7]